MADTTVPSKVADDTSKEQETKLSSTTATDSTTEETKKEETAKESTSGEAKPVRSPVLYFVAREVAQAEEKLTFARL